MKQKDKKDQSMARTWTLSLLLHKFMGIKKRKANVWGNYWHRILKVWAPPSRLLWFPVSQKQITPAAAAGRSSESVVGELQIVEVEEERRRGVVLWYSQLHSPHIVHRLAGFSNSDINVDTAILHYSEKTLTTRALSFLRGPTRDFSIKNLLLRHYHFKRLWKTVLPKNWDAYLQGSLLTIDASSIPISQQVPPSTIVCCINTSMSKLENTTLQASLVQQEEHRDRGEQSDCYITNILIVNIMCK